MKLLDILVVVLGPRRALETIQRQHDRLLILAAENDELRRQLAEVNSLGIRLNNGRFTTR